MLRAGQRPNRGATRLRVGIRGASNFQQLLERYTVAEYCGYFARQLQHDGIID